MSSRIVRPDDPQSPLPMIWRQVGAAAEDTPADHEAPGASQTASLQREQEQRLQAAHAAGFAEGETAGRNRAAAEVKPVIERLGRSIEELARLRSRLRSEAEADMLKLAMAIARRVLHRELAVDPDAMHGLVLGALEKLHDLEICRVRVHPSHAEQLVQWMGARAAERAVQVVADPSCSPGDAIFETGRGNLDASIDSQLQEIERGLADRLRRSS